MLSLVLAALFFAGIHLGIAPRTCPFPPLHVRATRSGAPSHGLRLCFLPATCAGRRRCASRGLHQLPSGW